MNPRPTAAGRRAARLLITITCRVAATLTLCAIAAVCSSAQTYRYRTLHAFVLSDGEYPNSALVQASDGNLYGTTTQGGIGLFDGALFQITPDGTFTSLASFLHPGPAGPSNAPLIQASDGLLWGTTVTGGSEAKGTIFTASFTGTIALVYSFRGGAEGANPSAGVIQASDGNFYGTTERGGAADEGTVFKFTPAGVISTLHVFSGTDGSQPFSSLLEDEHGNFYGTTMTGGANGFGTIFKLSANGAYTKLHDFDSRDGASPRSGLVRGADGNLYGTASQGGGKNLGTVYRISSAGLFKVLYTFHGADGSTPMGGLILAADGMFYGTTAGGGTNAECFSLGCGTAFKITPEGVLTTLINFGPGTTGGGREPEAGLVQASDGTFYGANLTGGASHGACFGGCGTLFSFSVQGDGMVYSAPQFKNLR